MPGNNFRSRRTRVVRVRVDRLTTMRMCLACLRVIEMGESDFVLLSDFSTQRGSEITEVLLNDLWIKLRQFGRVSRAFCVASTHTDTCKLVP